MRSSIILAVRVLTAIVTACLVYLPVSAFPVIKQYFLAYGVYNEACRVGIHGIETDIDPGMLCLDRIYEFDKLIATGSFSAGIGCVGAFFAWEYVGAVFTSVIGAFTGAAGFYVLSTPQDEQLFAQADRYFWGITFISLGMPFVAAAALDSAAIFKRGSWLIIVFLFTLMQLSASIWAFWFEYRKPTDLESFFTELLWIPCVLIACSLATAPFATEVPAGNTARLLRRSLRKAVADIPDNVSSFSTSSIPLLSIISFGQDGPNTPVELKDCLKLSPRLLWPRREYPDLVARRRRQVQSSWMVLIAIFSAINLLGQNLFLSSGIEDAYFSTGVDIRVLQMYVRPILAAIATPVVAWAASGGLPTIFNVLLSAILSIVGEILLVFNLWQAGALVNGPARVYILGVTVDYVVSIFGFRSFGFIVCVLALFSGFVDLLIPSVNRRLWLSHEGMMRCTVILISAQIIVALVVVHRLWKQTKLIEKRLLKLEAEHARVRRMPLLSKTTSPRLPSSDTGIDSWSPTR